MSTLHPLPDFSRIDLDEALASLTRELVDMTPVSATNTNEASVTATIASRHPSLGAYTLTRHDETGRLEYRSASGILVVLDDDEEDYHITAPDDRDLHELTYTVTAMKALGYEVMPEEESPAIRDERAGTTTWYMVSEPDTSGLAA